MDFPVSVSTLLNSIQAPTALRDAILELTKGHLIKGTVQRVSDSKVWLDVGGQTLTAQTKVPLQPQQQVMLTVADATTNQITLKVVENIASVPLPNETGEASQANATTNLANLLTSWGFEADNVNLPLAKALLNHGHSVNPQSLQQARTAWQALPNPQHASLEAVAYLQANQLPVSSESVTMAQRWLEGLPPITNHLNNLQQAMQTALAQLQTAGNQSPVLQQLNTALESALSQITNWPITPETPPTEVAGRLANLVVNLGTPPEAEIAGQTLPAITIANNTATTQAEGKPTISTPAQATAQNAAATPTGTEQSAPALSERGQTIAAAAKNSPTPPQAATTPEAQVLENTAKASQPVVKPTLDIENPLRQLETVISKALANPNLDEGTTQALRALGNQLELISQDLGAMQLSNLTNTLNPATEQYYLFPIPLETATGSTTAHLKVYRQPGQKKIDPNNTRLALLLDLPALGEIAIDLTVYQRQLSGQIHSSRQQTQHLVEMSLNELNESLSALGYRVEGLTSKLLSTDRPSANLNQTSPAQPDVPLTQVDFSI